MAKNARRYLVLRGLKYWFKRDIPAAIRHHFGGKSAYLVNLETGDIRAAMERRDEIKRETDKLYRDVRSGKASGPVADTIREKAELWAQEIAEAKADPWGWTAKIYGRDRDDVEDHEVDTPREFVEREADEIERSHGFKAKDRFLDLVQGRVDVDHHVETYLKERRLAPVTIRERRNLILRFAAWAKLKGLPLRRIDRQKAGADYSEAIAPLDVRTGGKHLGSVKLYWDWLIARGHVKGENPWTGQNLTDHGRRVERDGKKKERAFTEAEMKTLLYSAYPPRMSMSFKSQLEDMMKIAALSGMRESEMATLWVEECPTDDEWGGCFNLQQGKTGAAARRIPMHPELVEIVERRSKGKGPQDWLFDELEDERDPGDVFGKRFRAYRLKLEVDDKRPGQRRSLVNFHSFRRWFITQCEQAGIPVSTISFVAGHEDGRREMALSVYSDGPAWRQMRECVEAVNLPLQGNDEKIAEICEAPTSTDAEGSIPPGGVPPIAA